MGHRSWTWMVACVGLLVGLQALASMAGGWIDPNPPSSEWLNSRVDVAGDAVWGVMFLAGSYAGLRNRRRAGVIFLCGTPFAALPLSYRLAGYLIWEQGSGNFYQPWFSTAVGLSCLFYLPLALLYPVIRKWRFAWRVLVGGTLVAVLVLAASQWSAALLPRLAGWSAVPFAFGSFWLWTDWKRWPAALAMSAGSPARRRLVTVATGLSLLLAAFAASFFWAAFTSSLWTPDCGGPRLFVQPIGRNHVAFTARVVVSGRAAKVAGRWAGDWAIGAVQENFWGLRKSERHVLLTDNRYREGDTILVSGQRSQGMLTRYLPIISASACGSFYQHPVADAKIQANLLEHPRAKDEYRIVGYAEGRRPPVFTDPPRRIDRVSLYHWAFNYPFGFRRLARARIEVRNSSATWTTTTDEDGMYVLTDVVPDDYTLRLIDVPEFQAAPEFRALKRYLLQDGLGRADLRADWQGSIEGRILEGSGAAAHVSLYLENADGTALPSDVPSLVFTGKDGSFRFAPLPPGGRYRIMMNSTGPGEYFPYARAYLPGIFEIVGAAQIQGVDVRVSRLPRREFRVRVSCPGGTPAKGAYVQYAYEGTEEYASLMNSISSQTDENGKSQVPLFGDSRVRLRATSGEECGASSYSSPVVELETTSLPPQLDLVLSPVPPASVSQELARYAFWILTTFAR